ncbi:hypothetical protein ABMA32_19450 [Mesorhizobium sp. VNQ89]|uniref:hypothetical protein n=1 Tax=Mesorhizobium quangtriensis TaxID=3157709 RepID=UPI0032B8541B
MSVTELAGPFAFFTRRWQRQVPLGLLFWRDMVVIGSALNLAAAFFGLMALGFKYELPVALAVFHAPLPYNIFIFGAVWRTAELVDASKAATARFVATVWLVAVTVL